MLVIGIKCTVNLGLKNIFNYFSNNYLLYSSSSKLSENVCTQNENKPDRHFKGWGGERLCFLPLKRPYKPYFARSLSTDL